MITANIWQRVMRIQPVGATAHGTAFAIEVDGHPFLVTADHVVPREDRARLSLRTMNDDLDLSVERAWGRDDVACDIAVFALPATITPVLPAQPTTDGMAFGQDMYFLGYPLGLAFEVTPTQVLPFVKKATLSAAMNLASDIQTLYLDGHNNRGFSGGPIVYRAGGRLPPEPLRIAGVVSAFQVEHEEIHDVGGSVTGLVVGANAGIVIGHGIQYAVEAARTFLASQ